MRFALNSVRSRIQIVSLPASSARAAEATMRSLHTKRIESALITGVCGLLDPVLHVGDALIYSDCRTGLSDAVQTDANLSNELKYLFPEAHPNAHGLTWHEIVTEIDDKAQLFRRYNATAVDTETHGVLQALVNGGVRTCVFRIASDSASQRLPLLNRATKPNGEIDAGRMTFEMLRRPFAATQMVFGGSLAISRLTRAIDRIARV